MDDISKNNEEFKLFKKMPSKNGLKRLTPIKSALLASGSLLVLLLIALIVIKSAIARDHEKAKTEHIMNNTVEITDEADGSKRIVGYSEGRAFGYIEDNKYCSGISVDGIQIGGLTYSEARDILTQNIESKVNDNITIMHDNTCIMMDYTDLGITTNLNEILNSAFEIGRESDTDFYTNYQTRLKVSENGLNFESELLLDDDILSAAIEEIASSFEEAPVEPYITLRNLIGGGKNGVGTGGSNTDVFNTEIIYAPDKTPLAEIIYHNGANGYLIDRDMLITSIKDSLQSDNGTVKIELQFNLVEPTGSVEEMMSNMKKISEFSTMFKTSGGNRSRNVQKAAGLLHCVEIIPGIESSYNEILGPRYEADGWLPAPGISGGKEYVDSPGGGICQVSSTLYNALLLVGPDIEFVERHHHSIPGSYVDLGLDATVSTYGPDLVWKNNSDTTLFIISYADMDNKIVYSMIYGTLDTEGNYYTIRSEIVEEAEPAEPLMIAEPLWPEGYTRTVIVPRKRYVVNVYRQKYNAAGDAVGTEEFLYQDIYNSVQGEIHYGTGSSSLPKPNN